MKGKTLRQASLTVITAFSLIFFIGCDNDDDDNTNMYTINASMNGAKEVPANATTGTGTVTGTYDANSNLLTYSATWSGLTGNATVAHFHGPASTTATAPPVIAWTFTAGATSASGTATLTEAQEADLLNGMWYANVHTAANTGGEIRGQVAATR